MAIRKDAKDAIESATDAARLDLGQLKADFERLSENLVSLRHSLVGLGTEGARGLQEAGLAQLDVVRSEIDGLARQFQQQGRDALSQVEQTVRERPLASLLMAFGVGIVLARLFGRSR